MHCLQGRKLLTCRYWAFGPRCPDDVSICPYAHWDTGRLSDFYEQRGTCWLWAHGNKCNFRGNCAYEHRDTGMMGMLNGRMVLNGFNFQIANAAERSGFNTMDAVALMDLIWAARRITFVHGVENPTAPPRRLKSKIYPDYYRPGNPSVNQPSTVTTNGKRARDNDEDKENEGHRIEGSGATKRQKVKDVRMGPYKVEAPNGRETKARARKPRHIQKSPLVVQDATLRQIAAVGNELHKDGLSLFRCMRTMGQLWEEDSRVRSPNLIEPMSLLRADLDDAERGITAAVKGVRRLHEIVQTTQREV